MTEQYTLEEPPPLEHHFGWGMAGVECCGRCERPRTVFIHSAIHDADNNEPMCYSCVLYTLSGLARQYGELEETQFQRRLYRTLYLEWEMLDDRIQHSREEILAHEKGCVGCAKFWSHDDPRTSGRPVLASDPEGNSVWVHESCSFMCIECDTRYTSMDVRLDMWGWYHRYVAGLSGYVCIPCANKMTENGDYFNCSCGNLEHYDDGRSAFGSDYCSRCSENIYTCEDCDDEYWSDDGHECYEREANASIHSFDFRPRGGFTFHGSDANGLYLGFELEVESNGDRYTYDRMAAQARHTLEDRTNRGYLKSDGSLNYGFEIVSQPHTLEELQQNFPWDVVLELQKEGFRSWDTDTCGFHVHVSRKAFGWDVSKRQQEGRVEAHALRFIKLIYDNERYVRRIAGRSSDRWASFCDRKRLMPKVKEGRQGNDRYSAVNVANLHTFEVRVFKGTMRVDRIKAYLEFVHAAVEYTRNLSVAPNRNTLEWGYFRKWLVGKPQYSHITNLLDNLPRSRGAESEMN